MMDYNVRDMAIEYSSEHSRKRMWAKALMILAAITVFCTVYALIMPVVAENTPVYCGLEEHQHTETCYAGDVLTCTLTEHTHTAQCYSNPNADVENKTVWEAQAAATVKGASVAEDILALADAQNGYSESTDNYKVVNETVRKGYTRFGDWFGGDNTKYEDWNVSFVAFVLHYAGVDDSIKPETLSVGDWVEKLEDLEALVGKDTKDPENGYVVFFDDDEDGTADRVAIVTGYSDGKLDTIEGDVDDAVRYVSYNDLSTVLGYARTYSEKLSVVEPLLGMSPLMTTGNLLGAGSQEEDQSVNGLEMDKTAVYDNVKKQYVITIDSYANAESIKAYTTKENDIVLLLDTSGSMDDGITVGDYSKDKTILDKLDKTKPNGYYQIYRAGAFGYTTDMRYHNGEWQWYKQGFSRSWKSMTEAPDIGYLSTIYTERMGALQDSVDSFLDYLAANAEKTGADHKVSIITFSDGAEKVCDFKSVKSNLKTLKGYVDKLNADGATYADEGMQAAYTTLFGTGNTARKDSRKVVVMFTDGEPNHSSDFSTSVANSTIKAAKSVKGAGATIYTIGLFTNETNDIRTYMNYVSSNYEYAEDMETSGDKNPLNTDVYSFYNLAQTESGLYFDFTKVAGEIITSSLFSIPSELAVFKDTVTKYFDVGEVELYTAESYVESSTIKFKDAKKVDSTFITTNEADTELYKTKYSVVKKVNDDGTTDVVVKGFDFASKYCTLIHNGERFIIKIYVTPKSTSGSFDTNTDIYTNTPESGLYIVRENKLVEYFNRPTAETYEYSIKWLVQGSGIELADTVNKKLLRGITATASAQTFENYELVDKTVTSETVSEDNANIVFYYQPEEKKASITYKVYGNGKVASPSDLENTYDEFVETKAVKDTPSGAVAVPDKGYRLKGWYLTTTDIEHQTPVSKELSLSPSLMQNITYYAVFEDDVYSLEVKKSVATGQEDMVASFEILVTDTDGHPVVLTESDIVVNNRKEAEITIDKTTGKISLKLHAKGDINKEAKINNIPNGANISVVETDHDGYYVLIKINDVAQDGYNDSASLKIQNADAKVEFINSAGYELPHTGGNGTEIYVIAGVITMISAAALLLYRRRQQG